MGYKVKKVREDKGMTQDALAQKSGISRKTICSLENDPSYVTTVGTLLKIASALEVSVDQIFFP